MWHWILTVTGVHIVNGQYSSAYNFWSGIGSDIGEVVIIGGLIQIVRHVNCHVKGCKSIITHPVPGTPYKACKKHNPAMTNQDITPEHIAKAYSNGKINS